VYRRIFGDGLRGNLFTRNTGVYVVPAAGGEPRLVTEEGADPLFNRDGTRLFLSSGQNARAALISVNLAGGDRRVHVTAENASQFVPSPDEKYVAWVERFNAYLAPLPMTGAQVDIGPSSGDYPLRRISRDAGTYMHWTPDSKRVYWSLGPDLYHRDLSNTFAFETKDKLAPAGYQAITNAQIPSVPLPDDAGTVRVIAGEYAGKKGPARTFTPMNVWDVRLKAGKTADLAQAEGWTVQVVVLAGTVQVNGDTILRAAHMATLDTAGRGVSIEANNDAKILLLAGEPIDEPVVGYGPFVMNTREEIVRAIEDFNSGKFGRMQ